MNILLWILTIIISSVSSVVITRIYLNKKRKTDGVLTLDLSGECVPVQVKFKIGVNDIMQRKFVTLKTEVVNFNIPIKIEDD